ncbi:hypothetical protein N781_09535 [Pontibacillus halophilus JSM 076056 = DSM 19796]|uniref:Spermatogenesis-associated protein 20-like TRX domain-containing protein n=1 Tax=Pontibacillus halophilus JSM 076056 = DSM 19796 TaxID=1385510 RepID=A0A0A5GCB5_9BACI|nr:thioredoxin domain-containing protein [Pontibacillus halophilus]KGX88750.1 hypothetical protein N781_09535 [Pontibacillus halophilus JSM 076056 = DSM 19796]
MSNSKQNRLINEKSPYLQQHAHNPVDWYPWGEEAFQKAREENKPIFLSIGYSTCHWCHVMERETFEDEGIATLLNEWFVSIKVDREERPDIDSIYMTVCHMMNGMGGWPLNLFLTPNRVPFYSGTYFPKESRHNLPGFRDVILQLSQQFHANPEKIERVESNVQTAVSQAFSVQQTGDIEEGIYHHSYHNLMKMFDGQHGGFGAAPKFPSPHNLLFLFRYHAEEPSSHARVMATRTLDAMADGGLYDHIGYGFSRYSVDEKFLVPHFEKMLYDNAMLAMAYTEGFQVTGKHRYKRVAEEILTYVVRDMRHPEGGFYSAEDADSEGVEGKFYVWTPAEVMHVVGEELGELFCQAYNITKEGNFEGKSIPNTINVDLSSLAKRNELTVEEVMEDLEQARALLFQARKERIAPFKDDKILTSWNGLMIAALAKAGRVYDRSDFIQHAEEAVSFIEENLYENGRLMLRYRDGEVKHKGVLEDYAYMLWGYMELYEATLETCYLRKARELSLTMYDLFWDNEQSGFFLYGVDSEELLARPKEAADGALPSGNSVASLQLWRLAKIIGDYELEERVSLLLNAFVEDLHQYPAGHAYLMQTVLSTQQTMKEVVVLVGENKQETEAFLRDLKRTWLPNVTYLVIQEDEQPEHIAPFTKDYKKIDGKTTVYVCQNYSCQQPTTDLRDIGTGYLSQ